MKFINLIRFMYSFYKLPCFAKYVRLMSEFLVKQEVVTDWHVYKFSTHYRFYCRVPVTIFN